MRDGQNLLKMTTPLPLINLLNDNTFSQIRLAGQYLPFNEGTYLLVFSELSCGVNEGTYLLVFFKLSCGVHVIRHFDKGSKIGSAPRLKCSSLKNMDR